MRELGQHFLVDPGVRERILEAAAVRAGERVVEVGPGKGALTEALAARAGSVVAIEIDGALARELRTRLGKRVRVVEGDALRALPGLEGELLISNTPYAIAEALLRLLPRLRFARALLALPGPLVSALQARRGSAEETALTVFFQAFFESEVVAPFPAKATEPPAPHDGAVLRVRPRPAAGPGEAVLRAVLLGPGRKLRNGLREALIAAGACGTKREARELAARLLTGVPEGRVQALRAQGLRRLRENLEEWGAA